MKQTALEWFAQKLSEQGIDYPLQEFEQAKEMEKQQIEIAFFQGDLFAVDYFDADKPNEDCSENYYNKTFKS